MTKSNHYSVFAGSGIHLAFSVMVLAAFFTMLSTIRDISIPILTITLLIGVIYLGIGIYGYQWILARTDLSRRILYFIIQIPLGMGLVFLDGQSGFDFLALLPLVGQSVILLQGVWRQAVNAIILVGYALLTIIVGGGWQVAWANAPVFLAGQIFILVFTQMALNEEKAKQEVQQLVHDLESANQRLREYALQAEELAITRERNRLAREIHDGLGHHLTAINIQIRAAKAILEQNPHQAIDLLNKAEVLTQQALHDVRQSVAALRAPLAEGPLIPQIQQILDAGSNGGIRTSLIVIGNPRPISPQVALTLLRAIQEGLNNTLKHAHATEFQVTLDFESPSAIFLTIQDDGVGGMTSTQNGFGLLGMQERVVQLNGQLDIQSIEGQGFSIRMVLPTEVNYDQNKNYAGG
ncbi:MAG: sensor histidine kinase [Thermanaerothrix sp.]|uniref:histidine kinase n=3 Tax=Thermanaerothrix TaxID=1077886 RepID=A0ABU3NJH1_9CHLR|nr:sensor histidine kinase [Thermanaerothrix sp. 4228-RoL]MDT8897005.1 sensor histidine kinase [Thermanaerothrix sp. 4228-RoL]